MRKIEEDPYFFQRLQQEFLEAPFQGPLTTAKVKMGQFIEWQSYRPKLTERTNVDVKYFSTYAILKVTIRGVAALSIHSHRVVNTPKASQKF